MRINKNKELGISILEALMATVIVGVGFVAVFQMVNYSINSIDVSGERTKGKLPSKHACRRCYWTQK